MAEIARPAPRVRWRDRAVAAVEFVGLGRLVAAACSVVIVAAGAWWLVRTPAPPVEQTLPYASGAARSATSTSVGGRAASPPPAPGSTVGVGSPGTVVVQAAGAVVHPGVYSLPVGSRVSQLLAAAGGAADGADPDSLALAAVLQDGDRVEVPKLGDQPAGAAVGAAAAGATGTGPSRSRPLDLNRATADQLDQLPGIGPATAAAIVAHRTDHGPYSSVDGLLDVKGIGPAKLDVIRALVRV